LALQLYDAGFETVAPAPSYTQLVDRLRTGEADCAWGPPLVCARLEAEGGRVVLRALRDGSATYRSVLLARAYDRIDLGEPGKTRRRPRAAWVDRESMAGYVLPRAFVIARGFDPQAFFVSETFYGSFQACVEAVLDGVADLAATFAPPEGARGEDGFRTIAGPRAGELKALGYSRETPNDGVVLSPRLPARVADRLIASLRTQLADSGSARRLAEALGVSGFEEPPAGSYAPLLSLVAGRAESSA
jgi:phosphonate transport system substrate-binding protein